jgi:hypothetical protein
MEAHVQDRPPRRDVTDLHFRNKGSESLLLQTLLDAMVTRENPGVADSFSNYFRVFPSLKGKYYGVRMNPGSEAHHDIGKKKGLANYANRKGRRVC